MNLPAIDPLIAAGVVVTTCLTDAVYVFFNAAVSSRRRFAAASWSSAWYLLSAFAVISYTSNWVYVICSPRSAPGSAALSRSPCLTGPVR